MIDNQAKTHTNKHTFKGDVTFEGNVKGAGGMIKEYKYLYHAIFYASGHIDLGHDTTVMIDMLVVSNNYISEDKGSLLTYQELFDNGTEIIMSNTVLYEGLIPQGYVGFPIFEPRTEYLNWNGLSPNGMDVEIYASADRLLDMIENGDGFTLFNLTTGEVIDH